MLVSIDKQLRFNCLVQSEASERGIMSASINSTCANDNGQSMNVSENILMMIVIIPTNMT